MAAKSILITGATGFVGRNLVHHFLSAERPLILAVRDADACPFEWRQNEKIKIVVTGPIETATNLEETLESASTVVHLAGLAHLRRADGTDDRFMNANTVATERLARAAAKHGVQTFVHMSSLAAVTKNASEKIVDDTTGDPAPTPYGRSKRKAEEHVLALAKDGVFAVSLRPPLVAGAEAKGNWGALQRLAATGLPLPFASIDNRRSLVSIRSLVAAVDRLCTEQWPPGKSGNYCIADEESLSLPDIVTALRRGMDMPPRLFRFSGAVLYAMACMVNRQQMVAGLLSDLRIDSSRFRATFGFTQPQPLVASIAESGMRYRQFLSTRPKKA